ncbi:major facilitator superfamily domain-containing protein [Pyronema domesticum]|uniref:Similar to Putative HC-toxin efflux carrier TOXA acc. no. Q00357 n=1 Tax=Pyronema omphalodes (strain CBS 100304) TaxID=1076935 RepID=U4L0F1_PYROM|nr:major facilitator superfamily domain-containing protein [Pyronema domesticum]CCX08563.1 Similar to Putative HC-toxin efflux carrier TOXA; acc. no. Q00357 [Pyronema omphalodes CBS 100304]
MERSETASAEEINASTTTSRTSLDVLPKRELNSELYRLDGTPYPPTLRLALIIGGVCLGNLVYALDANIIATAIPAITTQFKSLTDVGWYGSAFLLTSTAFQPSYGKLYKYFDIKWTYIVTLLIFELGSIICALAKNSSTFIAGRAIQGLGSAGILQGALAIIGDCVPLSKRTLFIALVTSIFGVATCFGPILGGVFTDSSLGWRWCFCNLPIGAFTIGASTFCFQPSSRKSGTNLTPWEKLSQLDLPGAVVLLSSVSCLFLVLQWGGNMYAWDSPRIIGLLCGFVLLFIAFMALQFWVGENATVPPRIIRQRSIFGSCLYSFFVACVLYTHTFYLPFYFQSIQGATPTQSGVRGIPYAIFNALGAVISGGVILYIGYYTPFMVLGGIVSAVGSGLIHLLNANSPATQWVGYQVIAGLGTGFGIQIPFTVVQAVLSDEDKPIGNGIGVFFQLLGGAISIAITQSLFTNGLLKYVPEYVPGIPPKMVIMAGAGNLPAVVGGNPILLQGLIMAYAKSISRAFILPIVTAVVMVLVCAIMEHKRRMPTRKEVAAKKASEKVVTGGVPV